MEPKVETAIVRLRGANLVGAGFLAAPRTVLTCAHVVADLLSFPREGPAPPRCQLTADLPLQPAAQATAAVALWDPINDLAVLELDKELPRVRLAPLVTADNFWDHPFRSFGFPAGNPNGVWLSGVMRGPIGNGWVQLEATNVVGFSLQAGFSGSAVWDQQLGGIAGMVVAFAREADARAGYFLPAAEFSRAWPDFARTVRVQPPNIAFLRTDTSSLKRELEIARRVLDDLEVQARDFGPQTMPANLKARLEEQRRKVDDLSQRLTLVLKR